MKAISKFDETNRLQIDEGDMIIVIDGRWVLLWSCSLNAVKLDGTQMSVVIW